MYKHQRSCTKLISGQLVEMSFESNVNPDKAYTEEDLDQLLKMADALHYIVKGEIRLLATNTKDAGRNQGRSRLHV